MIIKELSLEEYQNAGMNEDIPFQNKVNMITLKKNNGWQTNQVGFLKNNNIIGTALISTRKVRLGGIYAECNYGPNIFCDECDYQEVFSLLKQYLNNKNVTYFSVNPPIIKYKYSSDGKVIDDFSEEAEELTKNIKSLGYEQHDLTIDTNGKWDMRWFYLKDLKGISKDTLIKSFNSQGKRHTKKALKSAFDLVEIDDLSSPDFQSFKNLMEKSAQKQGFEDKTLAYYENFKSAFGDKAQFMIVKLSISDQMELNNVDIKHTHIEIAKLEKKGQTNQVNQLQDKIGRLELENQKIEDILVNDNISHLVLSAGLFVNNDTEMIYLFGGNDGTYQNFGSSYFLQYKMMEETLNLNMESYNFYGVSGSFDGSDSVLKFKQGFGGEVIEYIGTYTLVLNKRKYKMYKFFKKLLGR